MTNPLKLQEFYTFLREINTLRQVESLLDWDQQVNLPPQGGDGRAAQLELLATLIHSRQTDSSFFELTELLLSEINSLEPHDAVNVRETHRLLSKQRKLPSNFVARKAMATASCYQAWTRAKPENNFSYVLPYLKELVTLSREETTLLGYTDHPYDALLDLYEPYGTISEIKPLLLSVAEALSALIPDLTARTSGFSSIQGSFPKSFQEKLCHRVSQDLGYSFESGRLDTAPHPFQTTLGPKDIRITTRWDETNPLSSLYSVIHEVGHALYEAGTLPNYAGTPMGQAVSLGIHESQSRFWENIIGRSHAFSEYLSRTIFEIEPTIGRTLTPQHIWQDVNKVTPSLIRVESDEITYTLHIVIRMLLEESLITGTLEVSDLPEAWNTLYNSYLHITPPSDTLGVLQDIHWYSGSIGYFPTYALGNLYGAMMFEKIRIDIPHFDKQVSNGNFSDILLWLRTHVHRHGMQYPGPELIKRITGAPLSDKPFIEYVKNKF